MALVDIMLQLLADFQLCFGPVCITERQILRMDLRIRTTFGFQLSHPHPDPNIRVKNVHL